MNENTPAATPVRDWLTRRLDRMENRAVAVLILLTALALLAGLSPIATLRHLATELDALAALHEMEADQANLLAALVTAAGPYSSALAGKHHA